METEISNMPDYTKSDNELNWKNNNYKRIEYRNVIAYNYDDGKSWTFWYGPDGSDYVSSLHTLEDTLYWIDKEIKRITNETRTS